MRTLAESRRPSYSYSSVAWQLVRQREVGLALLLFIVTVIVTTVDVSFLGWDNLRDILVRSAPTAIVACGVMLVVVTGEIDISVGSLMGFLAAILGLAVSENHFQLPVFVGVPLTLVIGLGFGLITGLLVTIGQVPSIIVTLGLLIAMRGVTTLTMRGENIQGLPNSLSRLSKQGFLQLPIGIWVAMAVVLLTWLMLKHMSIGRRLYACGSSPYSAQMVGLSKTRVKLFAFGLTGLFTAVATVVEVPRLPNIESGIGGGFELLVITCVVVGGVSISGGRGSLFGVLLAVILMTMVRPVLTFMDVGEAGEKWTRAIQGGFIIAAVILDSIANQTSRSDAR